MNEKVLKMKNDKKEERDVFKRGNRAMIDYWWWSFLRGEQETRPPTAPPHTCGL
jgi:hypothetical protein